MTSLPAASSDLAPTATDALAPRGDATISAGPSSSSALTPSTDPAQRCQHAGGLSLRGHTTSDFDPRAPRVEALSCADEGCEEVLVTSLPAGTPLARQERVHAALTAGWSMTAPAVEGEDWTGRCPTHREGR